MISSLDNSTQFRQTMVNQGNCISQFLVSAGKTGLFASWLFDEACLPTITATKLHIQAEDSTMVNYTNVIPSHVNQHRLSNLLQNTRYRVCIVVYKSQSTSDFGFERTCTDIKTVTSLPTLIGILAGILLALALGLVFCAIRGLLAYVTKNRELRNEVPSVGKDDHLVNRQGGVFTTLASRLPTIMESSEFNASVQRKTTNSSVSKQSPIPKKPEPRSSSPEKATRSSNFIEPLTLTGAQASHLPRVIRDNLIVNPVAKNQSPATRGRFSNAIQKVMVEMRASSKFKRVKWQCDSEAVVLCNSEKQTTDNNEVSSEERTASETSEDYERDSLTFSRSAALSNAVSFSNTSSQAVLLASNDPNSLDGLYLEFIETI